MGTNSEMRGDASVEGALRVLRDAISTRDSDIELLQNELARRDAHIEELLSKIASLEEEVNEARRRQDELARAAAKLEVAKRSLLESLQDSEVAALMALDSPVASNGRRSSVNSDATGNDSQNRRKAFIGASSVAAEKQLDSINFATDHRQQSSNPRHQPNNQSNPVERTVMASEKLPSSLSADAAYAEWNSPPPSLSRLNANGDQSKLNRNGNAAHHIASISPISSSSASSSSSLARGGLGGDVPMTSSSQNQIVSNHGLKSISSVASPKTYSSVSDSNSTSKEVPFTSQGTVDGRDFFKMARARLSYDEFSTLLWNVKLYNNREQTSTRVLENLRDLLLDKYPDLYHKFSELLGVDPRH